MLVYFSRDWDVHWHGILTHGHLVKPKAPCTKGSNGSPASPPGVGAKDPIQGDGLRGGWDPNASSKSIKPTGLNNIYVTQELDNIKPPVDSLGCRSLRYPELALM